MNRLILVGNGFDLAHGFKTSYKDFIFWYLDSCLRGAGKTSQEQYEDVFIHVKPSSDSNQITLLNSYFKTGISAGLFEKKAFNKFFNIYGGEFITDDEILKSFENDYYTITFKSAFLVRLIRNCIACNWVDIETEYFEEVKKCFEEGGKLDVASLNKLNDEFTYLKAKLKEYLLTQDVEVSTNRNLVDLLTADFKIEDFDTLIDYEECRKKLGYIDTFKVEHSCYVLNFNYTYSFHNYFREIRRLAFYKKIEENHIHGELKSLSNGIIFGFGDEHDKTYATFEEQGNNELFTHIKSYQYFKTPNYRELVRFLNSDDYQVYIMGHSCGLSDRTMFKEIFDHDNCKSVKIFHYQKSETENDYWEKTVNLGRHFSDKGRMRKLIVEFNEANAFPQL
jgi:hypothetical protein